MESSSEYKHFFRLVQILKNRIKVEESNCAAKSAFSFLDNVEITNTQCWRVSHRSNGFNLLFFDPADLTKSSYFKGLNRGLMAGYINLEKNFPTIQIRPETLQDKFNELLSPVELDFDTHKAFSGSYYMLTSDKEHTKTLFNQQILDHFANQRHIFCEMNGNDCLVLKNDNISQDRLLQFVNFCLKLDYLLNHS